MSASDSTPARQLPWWISPVGLNLGFLIPIMLLVTYVGHSNLPGLTIRGVWFFTEKYVYLGIGLLLVTALGCWIGGKIGTPRETDPDSMRQWDLAAFSCGLVALAAYLFFFRPLLLNPVLLLHTFTGAYRPDRDNLEQTSGITSLENFGPVFFSIYAFKVLSSRRVPVSRNMHALFAVLLGFTMLRVYAWSERLALIEAVLPFGLAAATRLGAVRNRAVGLISAGGPFFAIPLLIGYFGLAESVRSWTASVYHGRTGFWEFAVGRIASYYITSLNNGAGLLQTYKWPTFSFEYTAVWLYKAPFFGRTFMEYLNTKGNPNMESLDFYLLKFGDPEFNNPSGNFTVICDLGLPLGITYFALIGIAGGMLYRSYRSGTLAGALLYPMFFLTFLEVFRYPYLGTQRAFTYALGIGIAWMIGQRRVGRRAPVVQATT
jgi:hypothetical protein